MSDVISISRTTATATAPVKSDSKYPTELIELPSKGYFYSSDNPLSKGVVEMKMMSAREEDILANETLIREGIEILLDRLLESLLIDKTIKVSDLFLGDKNALFIAARRLAYGDEYGPLEIVCNKCGLENKETFINLGNLNTKEYDFSEKEKGKNVFEFTLPFSKRKVGVKILNGKDELEIVAELKALAKISKAGHEITTRLKKFIVSVDGDTNPTTVRSFVENELLSRDSIELRKFHRTLSPNIDLSFSFKCEHCEAEERMGVPLTARFFWPESGA